MKTAVIFGGSGSIGKIIARRFSQLGWRVLVAVRRPNQALFVRTYGYVGQVEPIQANIRDEASVARAVEGADIVVNCVGILSPLGAQNFHTVHELGAERVARLAKAANVQQFVHISALGAAPDAPSQYAKSKYHGEQAILKFYPDAIIMRPSVVFGFEDDFVHRLAAVQSSPLPFTPVISAQTEFQPIYVDDLAHCIERALESKAGGVYEIGGTDQCSMLDLNIALNDAIGRNRRMWKLRPFCARAIATSLDFLSILTLGLFKNSVITRDQLAQLTANSVVEGQNAAEEFGIIPEPLGPYIEKISVRYRENGEFAHLIKPNL